MTSSLFLSLIQEGPEIFLDHSLLLPVSLYMNLGSSKTSMANNGQLIANSTPDSRLNFIARLRVSVQTNIPQHISVCLLVTS